MAIVEPTTDGGRQWMEAHPEEMERINAGIRQREEKRRKRRKRAEKPVEATIKLRCLPSTLEEIKTVLKSFPTSHRSFSTRPVDEIEEPREEGREGA